MHRGEFADCRHDTPGAGDIPRAARRLRRPSIARSGMKRYC